MITKRIGRIEFFGHGPCHNFYSIRFEILLYEKLWIAIKSAVKCGNVKNENGVEWGKRANIKPIGEKYLQRDLSPTPVHNYKYIVEDSRRERHREEEKNGVRAWMWVACDASTSAQAWNEFVMHFHFLCNMSHGFFSSSLLEFKRQRIG